MFAELLAESLALSGIEVIGTCGTLKDALVRLADSTPDLVILDHNLPGTSGASGVSAVKRACPTTRIMMLTAAQERAVLLEAMEAGCDGFMTKRHSVADVQRAVAAVLRDETPVSPDMVAALVPRRRMPVGHDLTARETQVLRLFGAGMSNQDISTELGISLNTVRNHGQTVLTKLGAHSKLEAVVVATELGLLRRGPRP